MKADPRGSMWRQWDLHCHTRSSFDYANGATTDEQLVEALASAGVAAVAVTDHHVMDVGRIHNLQRIARDRLVVFPGIELRTELGGHESVHFVGIFPDDCDVADLWNKIQGPLEITAASVQQKGDERVYVPFTKAAKLFHDLGGVVSVHAGRKENSIERIYNAEEFKQAFKEDLAREHIDILEIGSLKDERGYREIVFPHLDFPLPLIITSDNHNHQSYTRKSLCWLKADVTFRGLLHVLHEPIDRVFLGELPPAVARVNDNRTRYVQSVSFSKKADSPLTEHWFAGTVPLNHGLVAIIGNKGSGKSALADIIGLLGDSPNGHSFSFLNQDKFRQPKDNKARHFEAEITWESCGKYKCCLDDDVDPSAVESVKYVPQAYLERVCNELGTGTESSFTRELRSVIFSHIDKADRLGHVDLDGLLRYHTEETKAALGLPRTDLQAAIQTVVSIEERLSPGHRKTLENQLEMKKRELANHDATKPAAVPKPKTDPSAAQAQSQIEGRITGLEAEIAKLQEEILALTSTRAKAKRQVAAAERLLERIANLEKYLLNIRNESIADCAELGLDVDNIIKVEIHKDLITAVKDGEVKEGSAGRCPLLFYPRKTGGNSRFPGTPRIKNWK